MNVRVFDDAAGVAGAGADLIAEAVRAKPDLVLTLPTGRTPIAMYAEMAARGARVPVTWLVTQNDTYFSPDLSKRMADAFVASGARVDFRVLPSFGNEGHALAGRDGGERLWGDGLAGAIGAKP